MGLPFLALIKDRGVILYSEPEGVLDCSYLSVSGGDQNRGREKEERMVLAFQSPFTDREPAADMLSFSG